VKTLRIATPTLDNRCASQWGLGLMALIQDLQTVNSPVRFTGVEVARGHLITNRNVILTNAITTRDLDLLLWIDSDCAPVFGHPGALYDFLDQAIADVAIVGAKCRRRDRAGDNVVEHATPGGDEMAAPTLGIPYGVRSVGLGLAVWNMRWWRRALAERALVDGAMHFFEWRDGVGEDYRACEWARDNGGLIMVDPRMGSWHDGELVAPAQPSRLVRM
jgi:hypothetical protein